MLLRAWPPYSSIPLQSGALGSGRAAAQDGWLSVRPVSDGIGPRLGCLSPLSWFPSTLPWKNSQSNRLAQAVSTSKPRSCPQGREELGCIYLGTAETCCTIKSGEKVPERNVATRAQNPPCSGRLPTLLAGTVAEAAVGGSAGGGQDGAPLFLTQGSRLQWWSLGMSRK